MAHINDLYEQQAKDLLHKLCDAMGIADSERTKSGIEAAIGKLKSVNRCDGCGATDELNSANLCEHCEFLVDYSED